MYISADCSRSRLSFTASARLSSHSSWLQWALAAICFGVTLVLHAEVAVLFIGAGIIGMLHYGTFRSTSIAPLVLVGAPVAPIAPVAGATTLGKLLLFFTKAGALTFGSGLVIVPFLQQGVVQQYGWLDERSFLIAVAVGMISPGPVVITATFVGYLLAGPAGAAVATVGIFLPAFVLVAISGPSIPRLRRSPTAAAFLDGAVVASLGLMAVVTCQLGRAAIFDLGPTLPDFSRESR